MNTETDEERKERLKREVAVLKAGFRCGECSRISYYRETEQWECEGSYCSPSSRACGKFRLSGGRPVDGTFPPGEGPNFGPARDEALKTIAEIDAKDAGTKPKPKRRKKVFTNFDALMRSFKDNEDNLIDYLQTSCEDCLHENGCPYAHSYPRKWDECREYIRAWLHEPYPETKRKIKK